MSPFATPSLAALAMLLPICAAVAGEEQTTPSGLKYEVLTPGNAVGLHPQMFSKVKVHYTGTLTDGTEFDSSRKSGQPVEFRLGGVIEGWNEGLQLMTPGARFKFTIPPELGFGDRGQPPTIPPKATLIFDIELIEASPAPPIPEFHRVATDGAKKTESGIQYEILTPATGKPVAAEDTVVFHLSYWSASGRALGSTHIDDHPQVGRAPVMQLKFLQEALMLMGEGAAFRFEAPTELTFGPTGLPAGVKADEPTVWLLEVIRMVDMKAPEFVLPKAEESTKTASGLLYQVVREGSGESPRISETAVVNYSGWLTDGTKFDSSFDRKQPAMFGVGQVIPGWVEGLQLMKPGAIYRFLIPPDIAYGDEGAPPTIPPKSTLVFYVELITIR